MYISKNDSNVFFANFSAFFNYSPPPLLQTGGSCMGGGGTVKKLKNSNTLNH